MLLQLVDLTGEVSLCYGWQLMQTLKTGQNSEDNYLYSAHSQMGLHHIPSPGLWRNSGRGARKIVRVRG